MDTEELDPLSTRSTTALHYHPVDVNGGVLGPLSPVGHDQFLYLADVEGEVVVLALHCRVSNLLPLGSQHRW